MEKIAVHPCVNTATLVIRMKDLTERILPPAPIHTQGSLSEDMANGKGLRVCLKN